MVGVSKKEEYFSILLWGRMSSHVHGGCLHMEFAGGKGCAMSSIRHISARSVACHHSRVPMAP